MELIINRAAGIRLIAASNLLFRSTSRFPLRVSLAELIRSCLVTQEFPEASPTPIGIRIGRAFPATIVCSLTIMLPSLENTKVRSTSNQLTFKRSAVMGTESLATGKSRLGGRGRNETKKGMAGGGRAGERANDSPAQRLAYN